MSCGVSFFSETFCQYNIHTFLMKICSPVMNIFSFLMRKCAIFVTNLDCSSFYNRVKSKLQENRVLSISAQYFIFRRKIIRSKSPVFYIRFARGIKTARIKFFHQFFSTFPIKFVSYSRFFRKQFLLPKFKFSSELILIQF